MTRDLAAGRAAFARREWRTAFERLSAADAAAPLDIEPLEELAVAAYLIGQDIALLERAHQACVVAGDLGRALRAAFWMNIDLLTKGEGVRANGWLARARRLAEQLPPGSAERGLAVVLESHAQLVAGDVAAALESARHAVVQARACSDRTLDAFSRLVLAEALTARGDWTEAASLLDEIMVATTTGDVPPIAAGILYCAVVGACHLLYDFPRARDWTSAFTRWCDTQPDLVPFRGQCLVHRVEIMRFSGDWARALAEAERTCAWIAEAARPEPRSFRFPAGNAYYELGEMYRLRGAWADAERAYRGAAEHGRVPEPGLALVRLAQGKTQAAAAAIRRALDEAAPEGAGAPLLAAAVEIFIAAGDVARAAAACDALGAAGSTAITPFLRALAARCRGAVLLARGDVAGAVRELRRSWTTWQELDAPYEAARVRVLLARAYREGGDDDAAELERDAARRVFSRLDARHDLARLEDAAGAARGPGDTLTARERQVIGFIAAGRTNKAIAAALRISERTVDRHVSNILVKLGVPTRAAATAFAYEHGLVGGRTPQSS